MTILKNLFVMKSPNIYYSLCYNFTGSVCSSYKAAQAEEERTDFFLAICFFCLSLHFSPTPKYFTKAKLSKGNST